MNESPPPNEGLEEIDERYRRFSNRDSSRPSEATRRAVLRHAAELAAQYQTEANSAPIEFRRASANQPRWRIAAYGGLAAAALAGLLIAPRFLTPTTAPMTRLPPPPAHTAEPAAVSPAAPATAESRAFAGNEPPSRNSAPGAVSGADARQAPRAQGPARESASPPQLAQMQAMRAPSAARAMTASPLAPCPPPPENCTRGACV